MLLEQTLVGVIRFRQLSGPEVGPGQSQLKRTIRRVCSQGFFQEGNSGREGTRVDQRSAEVFIGGVGRLVDHLPMECLLRLLLGLVERFPWAEFPLHLPGSPFHGFGLLACGRCLPKQVAAFLVVKPIEK